MKIKSVTVNNHKKAFEVNTSSRHFLFPYAKLEYKPSSKNKIVEVFVDKEFGREAFTYALESGHEGTVHIDHVLEYNEDPSYQRDQLLYKLTLEAQNRVKKSPLSRREIIRRLGTSAAQFYRLLDQTNYSKSIDRMLSLLSVLNCEFNLVVKDKVATMA